MHARGFGGCSVIGCPPAPRRPSSAAPSLKFLAQPTAISSQRVYIGQITEPMRRPMPDSTLSLMARTGLDQSRAEALLKRGLEGADDGELFLEYRQAEALAFDNGRLKQATYDTAQGFGLRAVKGEAVGYAHASDVSEDAIA